MIKISYASVSAFGRASMAILSANEED